MKKGYVFTIDLAIAVLILFVGLVLFFYNAPSANDSTYITSQLSQDVVGVLAATKISDLCTGAGTSSCNCPNYPTLEPMCQTVVTEDEDNLLAHTAKTLSFGSTSADEYKALIKEIFVEKGVIDETRFGFSILYKTSVSAQPQSLYHSEVDS